MQQQRGREGLPVLRADDADMRAGGRHCAAYSEHRVRTREANAAECGGMRSSAGWEARVPLRRLGTRYGEIWGDMGRYGEILRLWQYKSPSSDSRLPGRHAHRLQPPLARLFYVLGFGRRVGRVYCSSGFARVELVCREEEEAHVARGERAREEKRAADPPHQLRLRPHSGRPRPCDDSSSAVLQAMTAVSRR